MSPIRAVAAAALAALLLATAACDKLSPPARSPFHGTDVTGLEIPGLQLTDAAGQPRSLAEFRNKVVAVIFGFTQCPDVCPTTLHDYAQAMKALGKDAAQVQVLFVTVDPKRDTPELLRQYVGAFDPRFIGLRGEGDALKRVIQDFHIYVETHPGRTPDSYTVDHSSQVFIFDRSGKVRLMINAGTPSSDIASDLRVLLDN